MGSCPRRRLRCLQHRASQTPFVDCENEDEGEHEERDEDDFQAALIIFLQQGR